MRNLSVAVINNMLEKRTQYDKYICCCCKEIRLRKQDAHASDGLKKFHFNSFYFTTIKINKRHLNL